MKEYGKLKVVIDFKHANIHVEEIRKMNAPSG
jgi:hypothetical protein